MVCRLRRQPFDSGIAALRRAGLWEISGRSIRELSSGQRRRAVAAAAWIGTPRIVILDEPLESMDRNMRDAILAWVDDLESKRAAIVVATHDIEPFAAKASRALAMTNGACRIFEPLPEDYIGRLALLRSIC
jgi:ABC-type Mn2+/Zn2+ transport system ATPase subunit